MDLSLELVAHSPGAHQFLYDLLGERLVIETISHRRFPSPEEHAGFLASHPYHVHYLILAGKEMVGTVYLTHAREIGVFVRRRQRHQGFGKWAVQELMKLNPGGPFYANIAPYNPASQRFFESLGFHPLQVVYTLEKERNNE